MTDASGPSPLRRRKVLVLPVLALLAVVVLQGVRLARDDDGLGGLAALTTVTATVAVIGAVVAATLLPLRRLRDRRRAEGAWAELWAMGPDDLVALGLKRRVSLGQPITGVLSTTDRELVWESPSRHVGTLRVPASAVRSAHLTSAPSGNRTYLAVLLELDPPAPRHGGGSTHTVLLVGQARDATVLARLRRSPLAPAIAELGPPRPAPYVSELGPPPVVLGDALRVADLPLPQDRAGGLLLLAFHAQEPAAQRALHRALTGPDDALATYAAVGVLERYDGWGLRALAAALAALPEHRRGPLLQLVRGPEVQHDWARLAPLLPALAGDRDPLVVEGGQLLQRALGAAV